MSAPAIDLMARLKTFKAGFSLSAKQIAEQCWMSEKVVYQKLLDLESASKVIREYISLAGGQRVSVWSLAPEGYQAPLYTDIPGLDIKPLSDCFDGYTFLKSGGSK